MSTNAMPQHDTAAPRRDFPCSKCGLCCQHVNLAAETRFLDRGDGVCSHYNASGKSCTIYSQRPPVCRVDLHYDTHYVHLYNWDEFVEMNLKVCAALATM